MDLQSRVDELTELYDDLAEWFYRLDDALVGDAFGIMKEASALQASYDMLTAEIMRYYAEEERMAKCTQARVSREASDKVNNGDRIAATSKEVLTAWAKVAQIQCMARYVEARAKHLSRIYFDSKLIYENACRTLRNPVGEDKLVGHT